MKSYIFFIVTIYMYSVAGQLRGPKSDFETRRIDIIADIITLNLKNNGWSTILCFGNFPDEFYNKLKNSSHPFALTNVDFEDHDIDDVVPYYANTIIVELRNILEYYDTILKVKSSPYWHPLSNIILYYHQLDYDILPNLFYSFWYYKAINVIIVQYDDNKEVLFVSHYTPYNSEHYKLDHVYGCWTTKKVRLPITGFKEGLQCEKQCHNVSGQAKLRANNFGTCISFNIIPVPYNASDILTSIDLFEDQSRNLHGFSFRAYVSEVKPFFLINVKGDGNYTLSARDGTIWTMISKIMNFTIDLTPSVSVMKKPFNFLLNIKQIFSFSYRQADLYLLPIYLFDLAVVELDYSFPLTGSGACIMSHRAGFETTLIDVKSINNNRNILIHFAICFVCMWMTFSIYQGVEKGQLTPDQIGKDLLNTIRNVLLISLCNPPHRRSFRVFLTITIWSFFVLNFATQATIISFLTAAKRGKDVETFEDIIDKGYHIYGMASPDVMLPEDEERYRIINSRLVPIQNLFECIEKFTFDKKRFCLMDCTVARYAARNMLDKKSQRYLYIARDRIHSHYLAILHAKHSPITERFDKYLIAFFEAGLIKKWEQYRFNNIKEEAPTKPLEMDDIKSLLNIYGVFVGGTCIVFLLELMVHNGQKVLGNCYRKKSVGTHRN